MPYKKRSYYKHEEAKARDYSLFVIACEGTKTEPSYFAPFDNFERIKVRILEHKQTESAPSHFPGNGFGKDNPLPSGCGEMDVL